MRLAEQCWNIKDKLDARDAGFDCLCFPCNDVRMAERNMQIVRFMGITPSVAYCDVCRLTFRTRQEFISDPDKAKEQLLADFAKHECKPEPDIVNSTLAQIK
jgi:hypothetical protein